MGILGDRENVLDFVRYGFPTGYAGPTSDTVNVPNHPSAVDFPTYIQEFIDKELSLKGLIGPYDQPPFQPWCHVSPLMSRKKGDTDKHRVITDMTYPTESSVNAYIVKNGVYGFKCEHNLPTVDSLAGDLREMGRGTFLSTIDVSRAYKNFLSDPLDWPLLCFQWNDEYFCDLSMPFGARASSFHMQSVANCITDILALQGINSFMYLDDLVILSPDREAAWTHYGIARDLLRDLGLPEAEEKAQQPATRIKWLGIVIDSSDMTLSIPEEKVRSILGQVRDVYHNKYITKRKLQSLLGHLLFVAKCTIANHRSAVRTYIAFMAAFSLDPLAPSTEVICAFLEYVADHTPAPATVRNKISHVRTYLRLSGRSTHATEHPRVKMALEAMDRDKSYTPRVKLPLPVEDMSRAVRYLPESLIGERPRRRCLSCISGPCASQR